MLQLQCLPRTLFASAARRVSVLSHPRSKIMFVNHHDFVMQPYGDSDFTCVMSMLMFVILFCCLVIVSIVLPLQDHCEWNSFVFCCCLLSPGCELRYGRLFWNSSHNLWVFNSIKFCQQLFADFLCRFCEQMYLLSWLTQSQGLGPSGESRKAGRPYDTP